MAGGFSRRMIVKTIFKTLCSITLLAFWAEMCFCFHESLLQACQVTKQQERANMWRKYQNPQNMCKIHRTCATLRRPFVKKKPTLKYANVHKICKTALSQKHARPHCFSSSHQEGIPTAAENYGVPGEEQIPAVNVAVPQRNKPEESVGQVVRNDRPRHCVAASRLFLTKPLGGLGALHYGLVAHGIPPGWVSFLVHAPPPFFPLQIEKFGPEPKTYHVCVSEHEHACMCV